MAGTTTIEWTEATWNPTTGCDRVSAGCDNCYALKMAKRLKAMGNPRYQNDGNERSSGPGFALTVHEDLLLAPFKWKQGKMIFVNSMSDLFHPEVPERFILRVFETMRNTPQHTYQVLTKRPQRLSELEGVLDWPDNVWMGVSIESDSYAFRADHLRKSGAKTKFLSLEPLIGPVLSLEYDGIDWVIVGGESGHGHRPMKPAWVRQIRDACSLSSTAFFMKQWGGNTPKSGGRLLDGVVHDAYPSSKKISVPTG